MLETPAETTGEMKRVAQRLVEFACREFDVQAAWVHGWHESSEELVLLAERGLSSEHRRRKGSLTLDDAFIEARAARLCRTQYLNVDRMETGLAGSSRTLAGIRAAGLFALPLVVAGKLVGVVTCVADNVEQLAPSAVEEALVAADLFAAGLAAATALDHERRLHARLDEVRRAAVALGDASDLERALRIVVDEARELVDARYAALTVVKEGAPEPAFERWVQSGLTADEVAAIPSTPHPDGLLRAVPKEGRPIRLRDVVLDARYHGVPRHFPEIHGFMGVPIRSRGRPVAYLYLGHEDKSAWFTEEDERIVTLLAEHAGVAIARFRGLARLARAVEAGDRARRALLAQSSTAWLLAENPPEDEAARRVLQALGEALGWEWGCLWLLDPADNVLRSRSVWRAAGVSVPQFEAMTRQFSFPEGVGIPGRVWASGRSIWLEDAADDPRFLRLGLAARDGLRAALFVPVTSLGRFLGVIEIISREVHPVDDELLAMLTASGAQIGQLFERRRAREERERLLEELAAERSWLMAVVDHAPVGIVLAFGPGGERVIANRRAEQLLGTRIAPDEGIVQLVGKLLDANGAPVPPSQQPIARALHQGARPSGVELLCGSGEGKRTILVNAAPIEDAAGKRAGAAMVIEDISSLRELQQLREEWASMVVHDLRQPISVINAAASVVKRGDVPDRVKTLAHRILAASQRLDRMIADLADASHLDSRRLELRREKTDVGALVRECVERATLPGKHPVRVEVDAESPRVWVDSGRIEQVIDNLLVNAAKHGKDGGEILVVVEPDDDVARVSVLNEGPELSDDEMEDLFGRFRRGAGANAGRVPGIGLGLYICRGLVEAHGGRIWAERAPEDRIAFRFTLPTGKPELALEPAAPH